jgi:hypothetical protein
MRSFSILATFAVLGSILLVTPAYATDLEDFQKKVGKVAAPVGSKAKGYCTCPNFIPGEAIAGELHHTTHVSGMNTFVKVICEVRGYDAQGAIVGLSSCDDFVVLAR